MTCCTSSTSGVDPELAALFRALSHPVRLQILQSLKDAGQACCGDVVDRLPLSQSTVSQHLAVLKDAGLVTCEVRGRSCVYALAMDAGLAAEVGERLADLFQAARKLQAGISSRSAT